MNLLIEEKAEVLEVIDVQNESFGGEYNKYLTNFAIHDNKTPAGDTENMDMLDLP